MVPCFDTDGNEFRSRRALCVYHGIPEGTRMTKVVCDGRVVYSYPDADFFLHRVQAELNEMSSLAESYAGDKDRKEEELSQANARIRELEQKSDSLLAALTAKGGSGGGSGELYEGELSDCLRAAARLFIDKVQSGRYVDVLREFLQNGTDTVFRQALDEAFTMVGHCNVDEACLYLKAAGFSERPLKHHIRMDYFGDERYSLTMPLTPGDGRSLLNLRASLRELITGKNGWK